jgi:hypothetical protein
MLLRSPGTGRLLYREKCRSGPLQGKPKGTVTRPLSMGGKHMADGRPEPSKPPNGNDEKRTRPEWFPWAAGSGSREGRGSRRALFITLAACLCVAAAGVAIAVFSSPSGSQAGHVADASNTPAAASTKQAAQPTAPVASSRATTRPDVTSDGVAKSALQWPPQLKHQVLRWKAGPGGKALATVESQMGSAMQTAGLKLYAPMKMTCADLASDIGAAQAGPPIPYPAMQQLYAKALGRLSTAAADCRSAISVRPQGDENTSIHVDQALLSQSRLEFADGSKVLYRATAQIQSVHH